MVTASPPRRHDLAAVRRRRYAVGRSVTLSAADAERGAGSRAGVRRPVGGQGDEALVIFPRSPGTRATNGACTHRRYVVTGLGPRSGKIDVTRDSDEASAWQHLPDVGLHDPELVSRRSSSSRSRRAHPAAVHFDGEHIVAGMGEGERHGGLAGAEAHVEHRGAP